MRYSTVQLPEMAPRLRQVVLLFQRQDGVDVCLYCLYMQVRPAVSFRLLMHANKQPQQCVWLGAPCSTPMFVQM